MPAKRPEARSRSRHGLPARVRSAAAGWLLVATSVLLPALPGRAAIAPADSAASHKPAASHPSATTQGKGRATTATAPGKTASTHSAGASAPGHAVATSAKPAVSPTTSSASRSAPGKPGATAATPLAPPAVVHPSLATAGKPGATALPPGGKAPGSPLSAPATAAHGAAAAHATPPPHAGATAAHAAPSPTASAAKAPGATAATALPLPPAHHGTIVSPAQGSTPARISSTTGKLQDVQTVAHLDQQVTYQYNALGRRDPFQPMIGGEFVGDDVGGDAPVDVGGMKVVGIVWGAEDKFALCEDGRGQSLVLRAGDKVMNGVVESLRRDAVVVRITTDGQTQTVAIPLTRKGDKSNATR